MSITLVGVHYFISEEHYLELAFVVKVHQPLDDRKNLPPKDPGF